MLPSTCPAAAKARAKRLWQWTLSPILEGTGAGLAKARRRRLKACRTDRAEALSRSLATTRAKKSSNAPGPQVDAARGHRFLLHHHRIASRAGEAALAAAEPCAARWLCQMCVLDAAGRHARHRAAGAVPCDAASFCAILMDGDDGGVSCVVKGPRGCLSGVGRHPAFAALSAQN